MRDDHCIVGVAVVISVSLIQSPPRGKSGTKENVARTQCQGCGKIMPNRLPGGRRRRRDARFHDAACRLQAARIDAKVAERVNAKAQAVQA